MCAACGATMLHHDGVAACVLLARCCEAYALSERGEPGKLAELRVSRSGGAPSAARSFVYASQPLSAKGFLFGLLYWPYKLSLADFILQGSSKHCLWRRACSGGLNAQLELRPTGARLHFTAASWCWAELAQCCGTDLYAACCTCASILCRWLCLGQACIALTHRVRGAGVRYGSRTPGSRRGRCRSIF